ncbi:unnamed protein product [Sphagnum balticum]
MPSGNMRRLEYLVAQRVKLKELGGLQSRDALIDVFNLALGLGLYATASAGSLANLLIISPGVLEHNLAVGDVVHKHKRVVADSDGVPRLCLLLQPPSSFHRNYLCWASSPCNQITRFSDAFPPLLFFPGASPPPTGPRSAPPDSFEWPTATTPTQSARAGKLPAAGLQWAGEPELAARLVVAPGAGFPLNSFEWQLRVQDRPLQDLPREYFHQLPQIFSCQ